MTPLGTKLTSPESDRILVMRSPSSSTMPETPCGCTSIKSPTLYCPSKMIENPAITSRRQRVADEDAQDEQRHDHEGHVAQGVPDQGDRGVLALYAGHRLRVEQIFRPAPPPPQHAGQPVRQDPVGEEPEEDHKGGGDHVG